MIECQGHEADIIDDEAWRPVSVYNLSVCLKEDLDLRIQDSQLNEPDIQDLEQKMNKLQYKQCGFKKDLVRHKRAITHTPSIEIKDNQKDMRTFQKPKQPIESLSLVSNGEHSSQYSYKETVPKINFVGEMKESQNQVVTIDLRKNFKFNTNKPFDTAKLREELTPIAHKRFTTKKKSGFSQVSHETYNSNIELTLVQTSHAPSQKSIQCQDTRKHRSKIVRTTVHLRQKEQRPVLCQQANSQRTSQLSLLQLEQEVVRGRSQSSVSTPRSILKNPSLQHSQFDILSRQSRLSFSSVNISPSPSNIYRKPGQPGQSPPKKVKFCLTKKQARREHIPC